MYQRFDTLPIEAILTLHFAEYVVKFEEADIIATSTTCLPVKKKINKLFSQKFGRNSPFIEHKGMNKAEIKLTYRKESS